MAEASQNSEGAGGASAPTGPTEQERPRRKRSPLERIVVWGLIVVLLALVGVEAAARYGYSQTLEELEEFALKELAEDKRPDKQPDVRMNDLLKGFPIVSEPYQGETPGGHVVDCRWWSLFKDYSLKLVVEPGADNPLVLAYVLPEDPEEKKAQPDEQAPDESEEDGDSPPAGYGGGRIAGGPGGGPGAGGPAGGHAGPPGAGGPGGGPGAGGGRSRTPRGLLGQLSLESVQAELKLTDEQKQQLQKLGEETRLDFGSLRELPEEKRAAFLQERREKIESGVRQVLDDAQFTRAMQLTLRSEGARALARAEVAERLKLTVEQKQEIEELLAEYRQAARELGREGSAEQRRKFNDEWNARIFGLLTEEQQQAWQQMLGPSPAEKAKKA